MRRHHGLRRILPDTTTSAAIISALVMLGVLLLLAGACGPDQTSAAPAADGTSTTVTTPTTTVTTESSTTMAVTPTTSPRSTSTTTVPATTTPPRRTKDRILVGLDGDRLEATACAGADGATVATTSSGTRVVLVREEGLALRLVTKTGGRAETSDVETVDRDGIAYYEGVVLLDGNSITVSIERTTTSFQACAA